jgi:hypothetical protein
LDRVHAVTIESPLHCDSLVIPTLPGVGYGTRMIRARHPGDASGKWKTILSATPPTPSDNYLEPHDRILSEVESKLFGQPLKKCRALSDKTRARLHRSRALQVGFSGVRTSADPRYNAFEQRQTERPLFASIAMSVLPIGSISYLRAGK